MEFQAGTTLNNKGEVVTAGGRVLCATALGDDIERWLKTRTRNSSKPSYVAWLDSPEGKQLLMVAEHDFCKWEPTKESL